MRTRRRELDEALAGLDCKVLVVVDDMDRLRRDEIREVVKLVRLNADFPNVIYLLAFDRDRVERALDEDLAGGVGSDGGDGRAYLEKIVQIQHEVPALRRSDLNRMLVEGVNELLEAYPVGAPRRERAGERVLHGRKAPVHHRPGRPPLPRRAADNPQYGG